MDEVVSDYGGFDFASLWAGRSRITEVERAIVTRALDRAEVSRVLEVGVGFGRISSILRSRATEYVGIDLDAAQLRKLAKKSEGEPAGMRPNLWVEANAYHLPFAPASFSVAVALRIYHHIGEPDRFLAELRRCLRPGGLLLLQYNPKPTVGSTMLDLKRSLDGRGPSSSVTFSREPTSEVPGERFPIFVPTRSAVLASLHRTGFRIRREWGAVPELFQRWLPVPAVLALSELDPNSPFNPTRFLLAEAIPAGAPPLPPIDRIWACPACGLSIDPPQGPGPTSVRCTRCGFEVNYDGTIVRARFVPRSASQSRQPPC